MSDVYESEKLLAEYLLFHYGSRDEILGWQDGPVSALDFTSRTVAHFAETEVDRSLDVGCAVGRSAFEMSRHSKEVIGIDFSEAFIGAAQKLASGEVFQIDRLEEGGLSSPVTIERPEGVFPERVVFETGDAMNLRVDLGGFDRVHAANLVCRLPEPRRFLSRLSDLVNSGGELVLATPCTWLEEFTKRENWPKGRTLDWLKEELGGDFLLEYSTDEPFLIRETARKFQWTVSLVTKWRRK